MNINPGLIAAKMSWDTLSYDVRSAAYLAATWRKPPIIPNTDPAFKPALDLGLIDASGRMHEITFQGLELSVVQEIGS